jgi:hypothetical protein
MYGITYIPCCSLPLGQLNGQGSQESPGNRLYSTISKPGSSPRGDFMEDLEFNQEKFQTLSGLFAEIVEMQHQLKEKHKIKLELENELSLRKQIEEEARNVKISLEKQLADSYAERKLLLEQLENEAKERKRMVEGSRVVKISFEEELAKRDSEMRLITNNFQTERHAFKNSLNDLQQQFNTLHDLCNNGFMDSETIVSLTRKEGRAKWALPS